jgi:hypothetical protein
MKSMIKFIGIVSNTAMLEAIGFPTLCYDIMLLDLHSKDLHSDIQDKFRVKYLQDVQNSSLKDELDVIIWGPAHRSLIATTVRIKRTGNSKTVIFLVDPGSPNTYLCEEVALCLNEIRKFRFSLLLE